MKEPTKSTGADGGGTPALTYERVPVESLTLDPKNARVHGDRNLEAIRASLEKYGQQAPLVVDADGIVLAGNGRLQAARALGWTHVDVARSPLRGEAARAFALADNKTAELADWDYRVVADTLRILPEELRLATGFEPFEIEPLLLAEWTPPTPPAAGTEQSGDVKFICTASQAATINRAIATLRASDGATDETPDGACLEIIAARFLNEA